MYIGPTRLEVVAGLIRKCFSEPTKKPVKRRRPRRISDKADLFEALMSRRNSNEQKFVFLGRRRKIATKAPDIWIIDQLIRKYTRLI